MTTPNTSDPSEVDPSLAGGPAHADPPRHADTGQTPFQEVQASAEFRELRGRFRRFAFPLTAAFLIWYFVYVLLATYAVDFMSKRLIGNFTVGLLLGLLQFVTTFAITALYIRHANKRIDPLATKLRGELEGRI